MPLAARTVLEDCRQAVTLFTPGLQGSQWRIVYLANVTLLRAVYHVLKDRDAAYGLVCRQAFNTWDSNLLNSKPSPEIYWEFIVKERDRLIKQYRPFAGQGVVIPGVQFDVNEMTGEHRVTRLGDVEHTYIMNEGFFVGRDHRELMGEAIAWWEAQLDSLEAA
jgi:hypothetical protein